ncbi:hypothetical protein Q8A67_015783 [Cirrhinus molitorella]|uniref:VLIG-type G domain-containing protein n=1 Tax=Cirrhinus molitorella TaxID=172907 RepID=A0AA88TKE9_9TELE|nr:hypothetical protein Q8A67_015783 [Cirrhinus molitorella]
MEKKSTDCKFTDILEYNINGNNWYIPGLWLGTPPMAPVNTGYSEEVNKFKCGILDILKRTKVPAQDFMEFKEWIRSLWKAVQFENFIFSFRNSLVAEAYSKLCAEFNTWEWAFKKHMIDWYTKSETNISNTGVMSMQSGSEVNLDRVLAALSCEAENELEKEEKKLLDTIQQYFSNTNEVEHVHLVENHKEDFINSARGLRREVETDIRIKLENAILIQKGIEKVEHIKQQQRNTMRDKVLSLIQVCRNRTNTLSESELNEEFEKIWNDILKENSFKALPRQDVVKETHRLLYNNLEMKARAFQKMHDDYIQRNDPLKSLESFKEEWLADFKDLYYQRDQCQNKAEACAMKCFAPALLEYIQKRLGPDIVDEMLSV